MLFDRIGKWREPRRRNVQEPRTTGDEGTFFYWLKSGSLWGKREEKGTCGKLEKGRRKREGRAAGVSLCERLARLRGKPVRERKLGGKAGEGDEYA